MMKQLQKIVAAVCYESTGSSFPIIKQVRKREYRCQEYTYEGEHINNYDYQLKVSLCYERTLCEAHFSS